MKQREAKIIAKVRLPEAAVRLAQLYEALGNQQEAARWLQEVEAQKHWRRSRQGSQSDMHCRRTRRGTIGARECKKLRETCANLVSSH